MIFGAMLVATGFIASGVHVVVTFDGSVGVQVCSHGIVVGHGGLAVVVVVVVVVELVVDAGSVDVVLGEGMIG